MDPDVQKQVST